MLKKFLNTVVIVLVALFITFPGVGAVASERLSLEASYDRGNEIPIPTVKELALKEARILLGNVFPGPVIPLCDLRGNILAYEMVFSLSEGLFPGDRAVFDEIRDAARSAASAREQGNEDAFKTAWEKRWGVGSYVTMVMGARYDVRPILEYHTGLPPYFTVLDEAGDKAASALKTTGPELKRIYAAGYLSKWFEFSGNGRSILVNVYSLKVVEPQDVLNIALLERTDLRKLDEPILRQIWDYRVSREVTEDLAQINGTTIRKVYGVPFYINYRGCSPTAGAMLLGYWDAYHAYYDQLISGNNYEALISLLIDAMGTGSNGDTSCFDIGPGIEYVTDTVYGYDFDVISSGRGYYNAAGTVNSHWDWITGEIDAGRPLLWGVHDYRVPDGREVDHSVTVVGYKKVTESHWDWLFTRWECFATVHNTWDYQDHYWMVLKRSHISGGYYYDEYYNDHVTIVIPPPIPTPPSVPNVSFSYEFHQDPYGPAMASSGGISTASAGQGQDAYPKFTWNPAGGQSYEIHRRDKYQDWQLWCTISGTSYSESIMIVKPMVYSSPPAGDWVAYKVRTVGAGGEKSGFSNVGYYVSMGEVPD